MTPKDTDRDTEDFIAFLPLTQLGKDVSCESPYALEAHALRTSESGRSIPPEQGFSAGNCAPPRPREGLPLQLKIPSFACASFPNKVVKYTNIVPGPVA